MKLKKLGLASFGRFQNKTVELGPGLNLIYGPNEAGKSTLQKFILGMLYGFKKPGIKREYLEDLERYQPWGGDDYRGVLTYSLENDRAYRIERDLHPKHEHVRVFDDLTGAEVTHHYTMDRRKELLFAQEQTNVPQEVFTNTAWIGQLEVNRVEMARELVARVSNLQESGREDISVRQALRLLEEAYKELGPDGSPVRPMARLEKALAEKQEEWDYSQQERVRAIQWEIDLHRVQQELARSEHAIEEANWQLGWCRMQELMVRVHRGRDLANQAAEVRAHERQLSRYRDVPGHLHERLLRFETAAKTGRENLARLAEHLRQLERQREDLLEQMGPLRRMQGMGADTLSRLAQVWTQLRQVEAQLPPQHAEADRMQKNIDELEDIAAPLESASSNKIEVIARVEELEREIGRLRPKANMSNLNEPRKRLDQAERAYKKIGGGLYISLGALLLMAVVGLAFGEKLGMPLRKLLQLQGSSALLTEAGIGALSLALLGLGFAQKAQQFVLKRDAKELRGLVDAVKEDLAKAMEQVSHLETLRDQVLHQVGVGSVTELEARIVRHEQLVARRDGQRMRLAVVESQIGSMQGERQRLRQELAEILAVFQGAQPAMVEMDEAAVQEFRGAYMQFHELRGQWDALTREVQEIVQRQQDEHTRVADAEQGLQGALAQAGVSSFDEFIAAQERQGEWQRVAQEAQSMERLVHEALGGQDLYELEQQVQSLRKRMLAGTRQAPDEPLDAVAVGKELERLESERSMHRTMAAELAARLDTSYRELPDLADLARQIHELRQEQTDLQEQASVLQECHELIEVVSGQVHRDFAPRLNKALGEVVSRLTDGKYQQVKVDERLGLKVITKDDRLVDVVNLSAGTVDQFYFALRFALIDLITEGAEHIPLILDDPFVQYDEGRLRAGMEFLAKISQEYQIILCTCHQRERRIAKELVAPVPVKVIDLQDLQAEKADAPHGR